MSERTTGYDEKYRTPNFFRDRRWLYRPYVKALIHRAQLAPGSRLLDAGCGQGFFTALFAEHGLDAIGIDLSSEGVASARRTYSSLGVRFEVGDILNLSSELMFDGVFTRSCSLYNSPTFPADTSLTDHLLRLVRPGGTLIIDYYTRLSGTARAESWVYHSIAHMKEHCAKYHEAQVYFSLRLEAAFLGPLAFSPTVTRGTSFLSRATGLGGELVAFIRRRDIRALPQGMRPTAETPT